MGEREHRWQTKPLECWAKLKEMRKDYYFEVASAREQGKILVTGSSNTPSPLLDGLGDDVLFFSGEPYAASVGSDAALSQRHMAAAEERGYARDMCGYMRNYFGSMFLDEFMFTGGPFPKPSFCFTMNMCDAGHGKWYQVVSEHYGIPLLVIDFPMGPADTRNDQKVEYIAAQMHDCIDQMERITGRKYDDEKFIESSRSFFECEQLWGEICLLNGAAVPAPLELKTILALMPTTKLFRNNREGPEALRLLRDEVKDRIANQIAAEATERIRLFTDYQPAWNFLKMFRILQAQGVVFVGIWMYAVNGGDLEFNEDGTVVPGRTPDELGWPMRTREDVLRVWGRRQVSHPLPLALSDATTNAKHLIGLHKHWKTDGVVMHYNRGCPLALSFRPEVKMLLEREGIPVAVYEGNFSDVRDTDTSQILKRLNAFIEVLNPVAVGAH